MKVDHYLDGGDPVWRRTDTWDLAAWADYHAVPKEELEKITTHLLSSGEYVGGTPEDGFWRLVLLRDYGERRIET